MILAKFGVKRGQQLAEGFAVPGHQLGEEESGDGGVAFGEVEAGAEAAAFFAADEDVLFEHKLANVFEADGDFVELAAEAMGDLVDELGNRKSFGDIAGEIAGAGEMPGEQGKKLVRIEEGAVAVDGADAVPVTVGAETGVEFSGEDSFAEGLNVRLDGFGVRAAETRIARAANFFAGNFVAGEKFAQQAGGGAVHGVGDETEIGFAEAIPVDEFFEGVEVGSAGIDGVEQIFSPRERRSGVILRGVQFVFNLRDDGRQGAAAVTGFVLDSVPAIGIVAGGDNQASGGVALADEQRDGGSGAGLVGQPNGSTGCGDGFGDGGGDGVGRETVVVADDDAFARVFGAND